MYLLISLWQVNSGGHLVLTIASLIYCVKMLSKKSLIKFRQINKWDMSQIYSLSPHKGNFPGKTKNKKAHEYA